LSAAFGPPGAVSYEITSLAKAESAIADTILHTSHKGHRFLVDSFQSFFMQTLNRAVSLIREQGWPSPEHYMTALAQFAVLFRRFRAAHILFETGYPLDGVAHMRDVKDRAFCDVRNCRQSIDVYGFLWP